MKQALRVGGLTPLTTIDFPGRLAAVVFLQGCPWRCSYCQNPALLPAEAPDGLAWEAVLAFLQRRRGLLDGVVFSGGEPTLQQGLAAAIAQVRALGFQVGLHSAGMYPQRLAALLPALDWIGLDIKARWSNHAPINGLAGSGAKVRAALQQVLRSGVAYECRTTWHPTLYPMSELMQLARELAQLGVRHWALQRARLDGQPPALIAPQQAQALGAAFEHFSLR